MEPVKDNNEKFDIKAESDDFNKFIAALKVTPDVSQTAYTPSDEKNHFEIYKFLHPLGKCAVVYDTKASIISVTAKPELIERFKQVYIRRESTLSAAKPSDNLPSGRASGNVAAAGKREKLPAKHTPAVKSPVKKQDRLPAKPVQGVNPPLVSAKPPAKPAPPKKQTESVDVSSEYKNGYAIKEYAPERMNEVLKTVKATKGMTFRREPTANVGKPDEAETYTVTGAEGQKVILRYMPKKRILQMQGKRSHLFSEVQVIVLKDGKISSAVNIRAQTDSGVLSVANMQKRLKKELKDAYDYLGDQSKIDLTVGFIDIYSNSVLTDYSSLLTPPYRGLERFIKDLQLARGIEVKMIGQGYEKGDDGAYRLKSGYRKRIDSVVYDEVMSALYTEYFAKRNFYTHSDFSGDGAPRIISDRNEVKKIFENLIAVLSYNGKKLREINFP